MLCAVTRYVCYVGTVSIILEWNDGVLLVVVVWLLWCAAEDFLICDVCDCRSGVEESVFWDDKRCRFVNSHLIVRLSTQHLTSQKT